MELNCLSHSFFSQGFNHDLEQLTEECQGEFTCFIKVLRAYAIRRRDKTRNWDRFATSEWMTTKVTVNRNGFTITFRKIVHIRKCLISNQLVYLQVAFPRMDGLPSMERGERIFKPDLFLISTEKVPMPVLDPDYEPATIPPPGKGRAVVPFHLAAKSTRRKRIAKLAKAHSVDELMAAAGKRAKEERQMDLARKLKKWRKNARGDDRNDENDDNDENNDNHLTQNDDSLG